MTAAGVLKLADDLFTWQTVRLLNKVAVLQ